MSPKFYGDQFAAPQLPSFLRWDINDLFHKKTIFRGCGNYLALRDFPKAVHPRRFHDVASKHGSLDIRAKLCTRAETCY
jgi:hypothetical protein